MVHPESHLGYLTDWTSSSRHKWLQLAKTIGAPEMSILEPWQERVQAARLIRLTETKTNGEMKLMQAFYLGMMGVRYRTPKTGAGHRVLWPSQYAFLLNNDLVSWADRDAWGLSEAAIRDKSDAGISRRGFTLVQVLWFLGRCISRWSYHLPISLLENMTLAHVFAACVRNSFWWHKPKDVTTYQLVDLPAMTEDQIKQFESLTVENIWDVNDSGIPRTTSTWRAFQLVSRDSKISAVLSLTHDDPGRSSMESQVTDDTRVNEKLETIENANSGDRQIRAATNEVPLVEQEDAKKSKIIVQWDADVYMSKYRLLVSMLVAAFVAIHAISWNSMFPTEAEKWLWRSCTLVAMISAMASMQFKTISWRWEGLSTIVRIFFPVCYLTCRVALTTLVFAYLRAMPSAVYHVQSMW